MAKSYNEKDIQQILQLAMTGQAENGGEFSRAQLQDMAAQLGIAPEHLVVAERDWLEEKARHEFEVYRWTRARQQIIQWILTAVFLVILDLIIGNGLTWSRYPLAVFGFLLVREWWRTSQRSGKRYEKDFQEWQRQRQLRQSFNSVVDRVNRFLKG